MISIEGITQSEDFRGHYHIILDMYRGDEALRGILISRGNTEYLAPSQDEIARTFQSRDYDIKNRSYTETEDTVSRKSPDCVLFI